MNSSLLAVENFLAAGDVAGASDAFGLLRTGLKFSIEGLKLSVRIHFAAERWEQVNVLCRILRKEYPQDGFGFKQGAESLYRQGRNDEGLDLLKEWRRITRDEEKCAEGD